MNKTITIGKSSHLGTQVKVLLIMVIFQILCIRTQAQIANSINYTYSTGTSGSLTQDMNGNPIDLSTQGNLTSAALSTSISTIDIGFDYYFMGTRYTQFTPMTRGAATLGWLLPITASTAPSFSNTYSAPVLGPFWVNGGFAPTQGSNLRTKVVGTAPFRCNVMEWRIFFSGGTGGATPDAIFQMRMYESTGVLEYVYSTMQLPANYTGAVLQGSIGWINTNTVCNDGVMSNINSLLTYTATTALASVNNTLINSSSPGAITGLSAGRFFRWTPAVPTAPTTLSFSSVTTTSSTLNWTDNSSNEFGFAIYRSDDGGITYNYITQTGQNVNTYTQNGLQPNKVYYYKIYAISEGGNSTALSGSQATSAGGNIVSNGSGSWSSASTWVGGVVPSSTDNVTIANGHTVTIDIPTAVCNNLTVGQGTSGILRYSGFAAAGLVAYGNVTVASGATFDVTSSNIQTHTLAIGGTATNGSSGSLTVNGNFDMNQVTAPSTGAGVNVTFAGQANGTLSGSGTIDFFNIIVNKGNYAVPAQNPILDVVSVFTINSPVASASRLNIISGTFKISSASVITPYFGSQTICLTAGRLWLNNNAASVSCVGTTTTTGAGAPTFQGELRIDNGTFAYGSGNNTASFSTSTLAGVTYGSKLVMTGGTMNIYGALQFTSSTTVSFTMSGGAINIDPQAANFLSSSTNAFLIGSSTSVDWSGGIVTIIDPHSGLSSTTATVSLQPGGTKNITGGTLKIGDGTSATASGAFSNTSGYALSLSMGVWNLVIDNRVDLNNTRLCRLVAAVTYTSHYVYNDLTINGNAYLMLSSGGTTQSLSVFGNIVNNGILAGVESGSSSVLGSIIFIKTNGTQTLSGTGNFYNLSALAVSTFSTNTPSTVNVVFNQTNTMVVNQVSMVVGTLTHNNKLTIGRTGQIPTIVIGGNGITTTPGTFASVPNIDNTTFNTFLAYNTCNTTYTMGLYNEIGSNTITLHQLQVNNPKGLIIGRNLTIVNNLNLAIGDINIGNNNITLGTGASNVGTLSHTTGISGQIICGASGTFTRWVNNTAAPTAVGTTSLFPMGTSGSRRLAYVYFNTATALSSAGTISVRHIDAPGTSSMAAYTDGTLTGVDTRTNAGWVFSTGNGFTLSGTLSLQLQGEGAAFLSANQTANATITDGSGVAIIGTYSAGTGTNTLPIVTRTGLSAASLTSATLYIGAPSANIGGIVTAIATGNWGSTSTWNTGVLPTASDNVIIADNVTVTCAGGSGIYNCNNLILPGNASSLIMSNVANTLNVGGYLTMQGKGTNYSTQSFFTLSAGTINIAGWDPLTGATTGNGITINNGNMTISGGTLNLSNSTYCNRNFSYLGGYLNISGGNLNIFGKMSLATGSTILNVFQSGGTITIDPLGSSVATSCSGSAASESAFYISTSNASPGASFSGGTIIIVDPPYQNNLASSTLNVGSVHLAISAVTAPASNYNFFTGTHTVQLGDGVSTSIGLSTSLGFPVETYYSTRTPLNNLVINGGAIPGRAGTTCQYSSTAYGLYVKNLIINSGSEFIHSSAYSNDFCVAQSLVNNGILTQSAASPLQLGIGVAGFTISPGNVTVSGTGVFRNLPTSPTASFTNLNIYTGNAALKAIVNVNNLSVSGTLTMTSGNLDIGSNNFTLGVAATSTAATLSYSAGFILNSAGGTFTRVFPTSGLPTTATTGIGYFPLGRFNSTTNVTENRAAYVYFSTATALSTGGTIGIGHSHTPGFTTISPFSDGSLSIDTRSNSSWSLSNSGLVATGTIGLSMLGTNVNISPSTVANSTLCLASAAAGGTYAAGTGSTAAPQFNRTGLSVSDITSKTFYAGISSGNNLGGSIVAIANGYWDQTSTWSTGSVPTSLDGVDIPSPFTVLLGNGSTHTCRTLNIQSGAALVANSNTLTVADRITNAGTLTIGAANIIVNNVNTPTYGLNNSGTVIMNGGTMRLGPVGGGAATLLNSNLLTINDGTINLNGNFLQTAGTLTMTSTGSATLNVDGNDGSTSLGSVNTTTDIFSITGGTEAISGGIITIVDPPFGYGVNRAFNMAAGTTWTNNTLNIGDGNSTSSGLAYMNTSPVALAGFRLNSASINIGNVYVKGGNTTTRWASICNSETFACTNLTISSGSELRTITGSSATLSVTTNIVNGGTLTISNVGTLNMIGTNPQTFNNTGVVRSDTLGNNLSQLANLTINNSSGTGVDMSSLGNFSIGFGTVASGTLTLTNGPLNIGSNTLTVGTSGTTPGAIGVTSGAIIHSSGGGFQRWISATAAPTSVAAASQYPLGVLVNGTLMRRDMYIYFPSATLTSGASGTLKASHNNTVGLSSVSTFTDGALANVDTRTNSYWTVTAANGFSNGSSTFSGTIQGTGMVNPATVANITLMNQTGVLGGTYAVGNNTASDPRANRTGMSLADITSLPGLYIGGPNANLLPVIQSVNSGNWNSTSTWSTGTIPASTDNVIINSNHTINLDGNGSTRDLTLSSGSVLNINANTLTVNNNFTNTSGNLVVGGGVMTVVGSAAANGFSNTGTVALNSGTINVGNGLNYNRTFTLASGTLAITGGTMNVQGNIVFTSGTFSMSGGTINLDGNDGTGTASVASGTNLFAIASGLTHNVTGGTIVIVDPPYSGIGSAFYYNSSTSVTWTGNTLQFGNGISTNSGSSTTLTVGSTANILGFNVVTSTATTTGRLRLFNMIVNGGSGTNRFVTAGQTSTSFSLDIGNNLTITSGSELRTLYGTSAGGTMINVGGDITNNGTLVIGSYTTLGLRFDAGTASTNAQNISGSGIFTNVIGGSGGAKFASLLVNNVNTNGINMSGIGAITIDDVNGTTPTLTLSSGYLKLGSNNITVGSSITKPGVVTVGLYAGSAVLNSGLVVTTGSFTRWFGTSSISMPTVNSSATNAGLFPIGVISSPSAFNRSVALSIGTALTSGGTVSVSHADANGVNTGFSSFSDGGVTVDTRTNFNWTISTSNGFTASSANIGMQLMGSGLQTGSFANLANLRNTGVSSAAFGVFGTNLNTFTDPIVVRSGLDHNTLASAVYIGGPGVITAIANNNISASQTVNSSTVPDSLTGTLPTGGNGTYTYQWQSSIASGTTGFSNIVGATLQNYIIPSVLTQTTWYRRVVISTPYSDTSASLQITVNLAPIAGNSISANQTICSGTTPTGLTGALPTGGTGTYTYTWLSSTSSATTGFAAASGTNNAQNYSPGALTVSTWYRRYVVSGTASDTSVAVKVTVNTAVATNTISSSPQTICSGSTPASLTASTPTGGDGTTYTYTWLSSTSSATTGFAAASGTNNTQNYTPGALTANTWYRRRVSSGVCNADTSAAVAVTVNPVIAGNTIGSNQSIVSGTTPAGLTGALPTGGTGTYTYTWLVSTTSATAGFSAIASSNTQNYSPGSLTANTWYRRLVVSGSCSDTSSAVAISVISAIANNTISGASTICSGSTPTGLSGALPTGATGTYTYLWLSSTTSATAGFAAASGTNNTQNYSPGSLTQTTWFRRYVVSGAASDTSSAVTVTVNPVIAGNTVGSNQSILSGATPTGLTGALPTGGNSTYTYTWLVSTTSATAGFSAIASSNTQNYSPGALTVNTWYRRLVVSGSCSDTSSAVAITITSAIANNTISGASIICSGTTPTGLTGALPTGGTGTYTYTWLSSITSATTGFAAASGTNNAQNYSPGALTVSTWYRRYVVSGAASDTSVAVKVTVNTAVATNTISSSPQTICSGSTPASLTASTPTGGDGTTYTYTWLSSTSSATTGFAAASGTNNTQNYSPGSLTANTWYRRRVSSGVCSADTTTAITITVNSPVASNIVTGTQTICSGSTPALLTASTPTGGDGTTYTYSWLSSTTSATAGFAAASGTNNTQNYSPGSLTANTWYRRVVSSGVCSADTTTAITITVNSPVASNTVTGTQTICSGLTPALLTGSTPTGGDGATYTYSWLSSTTSATAGFAAASGTNNTQNYSSGALTQNTWYKRVVISGVCSADTTTAVAITVNSSVTSNTTTGTQTICSGSTPASLTASTPTGGDGTTYTYTWLSSTSSATIGFAAASGTNNTQNYTPSALTANTWYRRRVSSGVCNADTSAAVAVTVNPVIAGNTIGSNQSIVSGTTPAGLTGALPTGGNSTYTYTWLVSTTSATAGFSAIASSNTQNYSPGSLTVNTWYRRVVVSGSCSDTSSAVAISVIGAIANNTISGASTICTSSTPTGLSGALPTGATGTYTYLWLSSTTSATAGFAAASGTNNTQNYSPGSLTQTTWFRRYVVSGAASDTSAAVTVTVNTPGVWGGTVSTAWNNIANWTCPQIPTSTTNVSIGSGATNMPTITDAQQCNNLTINSGATLTLTGASAQLNIFGSFTNNGTFTNTSTGKTVFSGSAQQTVPAGNYTKLQINNAAGVVLGGAVTLSDSLVLSNGTITLGANNLTLGTTSYASVGNASSYIKTNGAGSVIVNGVGSTGKTGNVIIPVGNTTYNPATLLNTGTTDNFTIRLFDSVTTNYTGSAATGAKLTSNALNRTWIINEGTAGGSNATVTLQWNTADELSGFTRALCYVARYNGTVWTSTTATAATGSNPYTQTRSGITSFSPFSVGSGGTLPVELIVFAGTRKSEKSYLRWATASETNNDYFIVERSLDNKVFEPIGQRIKGQGNSNSVNQYESVDADAMNYALVNRSSTVYYRLRQVDFDGTVNYSKSISVLFDDGFIIFNATVSPNPFDGSVQLNVTTNNESVAQIEIVDIKGLVVYSEKLNLLQGNSNYVLNNLDQLAEGMYFIKVKQGIDVKVIKAIRTSLVK